MTKRLFSLLLVIVGFLAIIGCTTPTEGVKSKITFDPNGGKVNGLLLYETEYVEGVGMESLPTPVKTGSTFLGWYLDDELIESIDKTQKGEISVIAKWQEYEYNTPQTDSLKLEADYEGKDFFDDGIGVVTVVQYVDGDTTIFRTLNGHKITVRYQGIDTPESTYKVEAWGFAASNFTREKLENAETIVLQTENGLPGKDNADSTQKRYLAWVWADGRLVNLEIVECGLANSKASTTQYADYFTAAVKPLTSARVRIYGEKDPDFDYSTGYETMSLKEIREKYGSEEAINKELDKGKRVKISGVITRKNGVSSAYLQQTGVNEETGELETYGVYLYGGYDENHKLGVGYSVIITGQIGYYSGSLQITNVTRTHVTIQNMNSKDSLTIEEVDDLKSYISDEQKVGNIIKITTPITITRYYDATAVDSDATTLSGTYVDKNGVTQTIDIRIDASITLLDENGERITSGKYFNGKTFASLICIVGYYDPSQDNVHNGKIQLMLTQMSDIEYK